MEAFISAAVLFGVILFVSRPFWATAGAALAHASSSGTLPAAISDDKFCNDCGGKNPKGSRFCSRCGKALMMLLVLFLASWAQAESLSPGMAEAAGLPPHTKMEVGQMEGTLTKDGKPQAGKEVVIQVQQDGQIILTLPKKTDEKGQFVFKNIFKDPQYSYLLMTEDDGKTYRHGPLQLSGKQDTLKVVFAIKPEAAADMNAAPMPPESPRATSHGKAPDQWQQQQTVSVFLAGLVLALMAYALGRYQKKK